MAVETGLPDIMLCGPQPPFNKEQERDLRRFYNQINAGRKGFYRRMRRQRTLMKKLLKKNKVGGLLRALERA